MIPQLDKKKILDFVTNFTKIAKEKRWIFDYDADDDSMAIRAPKFSADARKEHVTEEFAFYITPKNEVEGVIIESLIPDRGFEKSTRA